MRRRDDGLIVRDVERLLRRGVDAATDGELLGRFLSRRDGEAFEALVTRHGPMVRGVCGRLLRDPNDADDAFQATFLVLARRGGRLRDPDRLGSWLYSVARRMAVRARARADRRRSSPLVEDVPGPEDRRAEWSDVLPIVDAEVARLPALQREVLALCLLGGASEQEAARNLDCPVGTVKSRLSRAREALRGRLVRRGIAPAAALAASSAETLASPASTHLIRATLATTAAKAATPPAVAALARGVSPTMISKPIVWTLALAGGLGLLGLSAASWTPVPPPPAEEADPAAAASDAAEDKVENLRRILLAMQQYVDPSGEDRLPPPALAAADGRPLLSWRVALLPYLGEEDLYEEFHLDEPWDSPHNKALVARMPAVFETPDIPVPAGRTRFRGFSATDAAFGTPSDRGMDMGMGMGMMPGMSGSGMTGMMPGGMMDARAMGGMMPGLMKGEGMTGMGGMMGMGGSPAPTGGQSKGAAGRTSGNRKDVRKAAEANKGAAAPAAGAGMMGPGMMAGRAEMGSGMEMAGMPGMPMGMGMPGSGRNPSRSKEATPGRVRAEIADGWSNTVLVGVAADPIEWTRPGEVAAAASDALAEGDPRGRVVGLVDGAIRFLPSSPNRDRFLKALVTCSGGEVLDWSTYFPVEIPESLRPLPPRDGSPRAPQSSRGGLARARPASPAARKAATAEPSLEDRLRRVEDKLDRLIEKLGDGPRP